MPDQAIPGTWQSPVPAAASEVHHHVPDDEPDVCPPLRSSPCPPARSPSASPEDRQRHQRRSAQSPAHHLEPSVRAIGGSIHRSRNCRSQQRPTRSAIDLSPRSIKSAGAQDLTRPRPPTGPDSLSVLESFKPCPATNDGGKTTVGMATASESPVLVAIASTVRSAAMDGALADLNDAAAGLQDEQGDDAVGERVGDPASQQAPGFHPQHTGMAPNAPVISTPTRP